MTATPPGSDAHEADAALSVGPTTQLLVGLVRMLAVVIAVIAVGEGSLGVVYGEPRATVLGLLGVLVGAWVLRASTALDPARRERTIANVAHAILALIAVTSLLQPSLGMAMAIGSLLPSVIVIPIIRTRALVRTLVLTGIVGSWSVVATYVVPPNRLPIDGQNAVSLAVTVAAFAFLVVFLWEVSRRLKGTAADLQSVVTLSGDIAETLEPRLVGDRVAKHIASAVGADDCALSYWDESTDRIVTLGYFPPEDRGRMDESYAVADYPATRTALVRQVPIVIETDDPDADPAEVALLESLGQRSMVMVPLVARGRTIGLVEVASVRPAAFDDHAIQLAVMLAGESAMALENSRLYDEIRSRALHDGLTGLANRVLFRDRVEHAVVRNRRGARQVAVLFIDLDDFKVLNDTHGHHRGDEVLVIAAERLTSVLRPSDTAARLGGDEFAVLIEDVQGADEALAVATRVADALRQQVPIGHASVRIAASIGVAIGAGGRETADDLLRNADVAMYAAKRSARGGAELFRPALREGMKARAERAARLRGAEERGEMRLDYQPIVELATNRIVGVEALVRWQPPEGPILMPDAWIDLAEESGEIVPIGRWVLHEACRQARDWQIRLGRPDLRMSVNLSTRQFVDHDIVATTRAALLATGLPPGTLTLEITESGLMQRTESSIGRLEALRALGVNIAIDDFGTGYSSLSYLDSFPIDELKIDRSFVSSAVDGLSHVARAVLDLGRTLGLEVVAEGVERLDQARWLIDLGCQYGQGYLYARPVGPSAIEALLAEGQGLARPIEMDADSAAEQAGNADIAHRLRLVSGE